MRRAKSEAEMLQSECLSNSPTKNLRVRLREEVLSAIMRQFDCRLALRQHHAEALGGDDTERFDQLRIVRERQSHKARRNIGKSVQVVCATRVAGCNFLLCDCSEEERQEEICERIVSKD